MSREWIAFALFLCLLFGGLSSASAAPPPAKIIGSAVSNVVSALVKWLWSLHQQSSPRTDVSTRAMMKFETGYDVETVFDGTKIGIEPHSIEVSRDGELLILDSENSNMYKISIPLSRHSRPKLIAGSSEGHSGHVDGRAREARLNHPKGLTVDDRGNIYIADTMNMAIRKISDSGISTIAGGKWGRGVGHVDGPSGEAKFSNDFDLVYVGISCSLMVVDRGNQAVREIQLRAEDCDSHEDGGSFHLGFVVLVAAAFFGYMMALLQQRVRAVFSPRNDSRVPSMEKPSPMAPYQRPPPNTKSIRPPLIPPEPDEPEETEDGFFSSAAKLTVNTVSSMAEIVTGLIPGPRKKPKIHHHGYRPTFHHPNQWPPQESYMIPNEDEPPPLEETRASPPPNNNTYPYYNDHHQIEKKKKQQQQPRLDGPSNNRARHYHPHPNHHHEQHHQRHYLSDPNTYYEKSNSETNEIVFGAVQEGDGRREAMVIKAVDYGDPKYNRHNIRSRINYMGYSQAY